MTTHQWIVSHTLVSLQEAEMTRSLSKWTLWWYVGPSCDYPRNCRRGTHQQFFDIFHSDWKFGHHDNALAHSLHLILAKNQNPVVCQAPYSPDMAPYNFWLFSKLKRPSKGKRFQDKRGHYDCNWKSDKSIKQPHWNAPFHQMTLLVDMIKFMHTYEVTSCSCTSLKSTRCSGKKRSDTFLIEGYITAFKWRKWAIICCSYNVDVTSQVLKNISNSIHVYTICYKLTVSACKLMCAVRPNLPLECVVQQAYPFQWGHLTLLYQVNNVRCFNHFLISRFFIFF